MFVQEKPRYASADRSSSNTYTFGDSKLSEREKKIQYAKELEAQIKQRREGNGQNSKKNEDFFPFSNENADKKKTYAKELEEQIRAKQKPESLTEAMNSKKERDEKARVEPSGQSAEVDKKLKYRQELERQMEEQKQRKEEEKRKKKIEDNIVETGLFGLQETQKKVPKLPEKETDQKTVAKVPEKTQKPEEVQKPETKEEPASRDLKNSKSPEPSDTKKGVITENPDIKRLNSPESNMESKKISPSDRLSPVHSYRAANEIISPFDQDRQHKSITPGNSLFSSSTLLIENYIKEIQEVRLERDKAKEQCMEMRELMLKEKEKSLDQMLSALRNLNDNHSEKPPIYPVKNPAYNSPKNDYAAVVFDQVQKQLFKPELQSNGELISTASLLEKSLRSNSEFINPNTPKWGDLNLIENSQSTKAKFSLEKFPALNDINEVNESLPGNNTYLSPKNDEDLFKEFEQKYMKKLLEVQQKLSPTAKDPQKKPAENVNLIASSQKNLSRRSSPKDQRLFNRFQEA